VILRVHGSGSLDHTEVQAKVTLVLPIVEQFGYGEFGSQYKHGYSGSPLLPNW
jgi:hypothetical protein